MSKTPTSNAGKNGIYEIVFDEKSSLEGFGVLIESRIGFSCDGDRFIINSHHYYLLKEANVSFQIVNE
jgi:hypothetical protein